jgi:hypothetical protein
MRWMEHITFMREMRNVYNILAVKPEGKRSLGRPRSRWKYNIKTDIRNVNLLSVNWMLISQD